MPRSRPRTCCKTPIRPLTTASSVSKAFSTPSCWLKFCTASGPSRSATNSKTRCSPVADFDLGIGEQVSFGPDRRQGLQRVYYTVVDEGRFVPLDDWRARFA